jgi:hypothetical protein
MGSKIMRSDEGYEIYIGKGKIIVNFFGREKTFTPEEIDVMYVTVPLNKRLEPKEWMTALHSKEHLAVLRMRKIIVHGHNPMIENK